MIPMWLSTRVPRLAASLGGGLVRKWPFPGSRAAESGLWGIGFPAL